MRTDSVSVKQPIFIIYPQKVIPPSRPTAGCECPPGLHLGLKFPGTMNDWLVEQHQAGLKALTDRYGEKIAFGFHNRCYIYGKLYVVALSPPAIYSAAQSLQSVVRRCLASDAILHKAKDCAQMDQILTSIH